MLSQFPIEIWCLIYYHVSRIQAAECIRRRYRFRKFRHARMTEWSSLRRIILQELTFAQIDILFDNVLIRREWRTEPESWIYEIEKRPQNLTDIVKEVQNGMWNYKGSSIDAIH